LGVIQQLRQNVNQFVKSARENHPNGKVLDVAPDEWAVVSLHYPDVTTVNIAPGCNITADITDCPQLASNHWDLIFCLEVLEHVYEPFRAASELMRMLAPGGHLFISTPFHFEVHGPPPDCWRLGEDGLRYMFRDHEIVEFNSMGNQPFPIHHTMVVRK